MFKVHQCREALQDFDPDSMEHSAQFLVLAVTSCLLSRICQQGACATEPAEAL